MGAKAHFSRLLVSLALVVLVLWELERRLVVKPFLTTTTTKAVTTTTTTPKACQTNDTTTTTKDSSSSSSASLALPEIPFYVYPLEFFPSFWGRNSTCQHHQPLAILHDSEVHALQAMKRHPWRTSDPRQAKLVYVPLALGLFALGGCPGLTATQILQELQDVVIHNTHNIHPHLFPNIRHLFIGQNYKGSAIYRQVKQLLAPAGIHAALHGRGNCQTSVPYTSNYAAWASLRDANNPTLPSWVPLGASRTYSVHMVGRFDLRKAYLERKAIFTEHESQPIPHAFIVSAEDPKYSQKSNDTTLQFHKAFRAGTRLVGPVRFCANRTDTNRCIAPAALAWPNRYDTQMAQQASNFTLAMPGDTAGSDRWINGMVAGTVMIQIEKPWNNNPLFEQSTWTWHPFPCAVPWRDIVLTIPRHEFMASPSKAIRAVMNSVMTTTTIESSSPSPRLLELQRRTLYHAADLDWTAYHSRALENLLREAYFIPCTAFDAQAAGDNPPRSPLLEQDWCIENQRLATIQGKAFAAKHAAAESAAAAKIGV